MTKSWNDYAKKLLGQIWNIILCIWYKFRLELEVLKAGLKFLQRLMVKKGIGRFWRWWHNPDIDIESVI